MKNIKEIKQIAPKIYQIVPQGNKLALDVVRFQEYNDSPIYRHKIFNRKEIFDYIIKTMGKKSFYYENVGGYNFSDESLTPFYNKKFKHITKAEKYILNHFKDIKPPYYIIIALSCLYEKSIIKHEKAHAFYYLNEEYKTNVSKILKDFINTFPIDLKTKFIEKNMYHPDIFEDEIQAYLISNAEDFENYVYCQKIDNNIINALKIEFKKQLACF